MSSLDVDIGHGEGDSIMNKTKSESARMNGSDQNLNNDEEPSEIFSKDSEFHLCDNLEYPTREQINENEQKLKDRINQFRKSIESLKEDLIIEKDKLNSESKIDMKPQNLKYFPQVNNHKSESENSFLSNNVESTVSNWFTYDQNLVEYEKQLQKYQDALTIAQIEKKNAIRKQMMAKAYKLKLLEVENQCNIELLRLKQNLQYLEPLKTMAQQWKTELNSSDSVKCDNIDDLCSLAELRTKSLLDFNDNSDKSSELSQCNILDIIPCSSSLSSPRH